MIQQRAAAWVEQQTDDSDGSPSGDTKLFALQRAIHKAIEAERDPVCRLRLLWTAHAALTPADLDLQQVFAATTDEHLRVWQLRLALDQFAIGGEHVPQKLAESLASVARDEESGLVQLYLASALQRLPLQQRWAIAEALCSHSQFAGDRTLPLMIWYGIEPAVARDRTRALELVAASQIPLIRQYVARRLTEDIETDPETVNALVELAARAEPRVTQDILVGMVGALRGWSKAPQPAAWSSAASQFASSDSADLKHSVQELGVVFGDGRATDELRAMVVDADADPDTRRQALRSLLVGRPADLAGALQKLAGDRVMAFEAIRGLAFYDHPDTPRWISRNWGIYGPAERAEAINTLCTRPAYAKALLGMLGGGQIAKSDVTAFHARQIAGFDDPLLNRQLAELWGEVRVSTAEKRALIERFKSQITPEALAQAQPAAGRALFQKNCASCHVLFGAGRKVGPDLTGSNRRNLDYLLENVIDPSASVGADFQTWVVVLDDGRVVNGVITEQSERTLTLQTAQEPITLDRRSIDQMQHTRNSLMPDGVLQQLSDEQVRDLLSYLMSPDQVPLLD